MKWTQFPRIEIGKKGVVEGRIVAVPISPTQGVAREMVGTAPMDDRFFESRGTRLIEYKNKLIIAVAVRGPEDARMFGASAWKAAEQFLGPVKFHLVPDFLPEGEVLEGALLASYRFGKYKTKADERPWIVFHGSENLVERITAKVRGVFVARDISNEPGNTLYPESLAETVRDAFGGTRVEVEVHPFDWLKQKGFGGMVAVGQGSTNKPRLIVMTYLKGGDHRTKLIVGKGVTFDTGGINLKPTEHINGMKLDVCGAAAVIGAMWAIQAMDLPLNVVALVPAAENMPGSEATRPSDIITMYNGKTVEVTNTDAEGRLILADALAYGIERFSPDAVVDLATLTGACSVALGKRVAGILGNHKGLTKDLIDAGEKEGEKIWELPMFDHYLEDMKSEVADLANASKERYAGACNAAKFLEQFVGGHKWAHLDIAGPASAESEWEWNPKGGTGFGVKTLVNWLSMRT
ncbi:MAG TPA: leucyl aminopeptidase [archaeon]|nr:leucyl aminopeptidase [archaeon]